MSDIRLLTRQLGPSLLKDLEEATSICILTSFVMHSGVRYLSDHLHAAAERGAEVKICTGDYFFVTQPEALDHLIHLHPGIEVRLWQSNGLSFHPKAYVLKSNSSEHVYVGSSNLSRSALGDGVEWNLAVDNHLLLYEEALDQFSKTFNANETIPLNQETLKNYRDRYDAYHKTNPDTVKQWTEAEELDLTLPEEEVQAKPGIVHETKASYETKIKPRFAQVEALAELENTLEEEYTKALVVMATGLGKTYLAAFFARRFKRILFIAHRQEILYQAQSSFERVMPEVSTGMYHGKVKERDADVTFASVFTLSMEHHLTKFSPDEFDLIIVDEFHHAAAATYTRVLDYFGSDFLLGITATPDRNDNKDVFALCDGNVAFRFDFLDAIEKGWLSPFHYYGVYDDTDYSQLTWLGNRYAEDELLVVQLRDDMAAKIFQAWQEKKQTRTLAFCSSIRQATFLSSYFQNQGVQAGALHSEGTIDRNQAVQQLSTGELEVIFTVDLFNEGVDIPAVDTLLFVRPTESLTIFTQQIGRGLRLHPNKQNCVIIDLIGNYRNADLKLQVLEQSEETKGKNEIAPTVPQGCAIDLDVQVVSLLKEMSRKKQPRKERLLRDYETIKQELGRRPTYVELHLKGSSTSVEYRQEYRSYIGFLYANGELDEREQAIYTRYEHWIQEVERTNMSRSYKMVLLKTMLDRGEDSWSEPITAEAAAPGFQQYYLEREYRFAKEFGKDKSKGNQEHWINDRNQTIRKIEEMPMTKWSGSSDGLIWFNDGQFGLGFDVDRNAQEQLYKWTREICDYRLHWYFERKG